MPKEQVFGLLRIDWGRLPSEGTQYLRHGWGEHQSLVGFGFWFCWFGSHELMGRPKNSRLCQMVPEGYEGFHSDEGTLREMHLPCPFLPSLQALAGGSCSCSQGETQAKEGWRPSCLPTCLRALPVVLCTSHYTSFCHNSLVDSTVSTAGVPNRWARLAGDQASPARETSPRPFLAQAG